MIFIIGSGKPSRKRGLFCVLNDIGLINYRNPMENKTGCQNLNFADYK